MGASGDRGTARAGLKDLFALLATLVALAVILHQLWWDGFDARHGSVVLVATWTLLRPSSVPRFLLLLGTEVYTVAVDMPNVGDHILVLTIVSLFILFQAGWEALRGRALPPPVELFRRVAPLLRLTAILIYAAAALAKLNTAFLDPAVSCAAEELSRIPLVDPAALGQWSVELAIVATIATEAALAVLLAVPRTRTAGLLLGCGFHLVLVLAGNVPFAAVMLALYVGFLPASAPTVARASLRRWKAPVSADRSGALGRAVAGLVGSRGRPGGAVGAVGARWWTVIPLQLAALVALVGIWQLAGLFMEAEPEAAETLLEIGARLVVGTMIVVAVAIWLDAHSRGPRRTHAVAVGSVRRLSPILAVAVAVLALNALSPYLGLKTQTSLNMFSNLRTEEGRWNHLIVPSEVRIFELQDELVEITASNDPVLARNAERDQRVVRYELERYLRRHPASFATYVPASGGPPRLAVGGGEGSLGEQLAGKIARFRPIPAPGASSC